MTADKLASITVSRMLLFPSFLYEIDAAVHTDKDAQEFVEALRKAVTVARKQARIILEVDANENNN